MELVRNSLCKPVSIEDNTSSEKRSLSKANISDCVFFNLIHYLSGS